MLNFVKFGEGEKHIWLHGFLRCLKDLMPLAEGMRGCHYLVDFRNHGDSFHSDDCSLEVLVSDVLNLMDIENIDRANLIGFSMGGKVAMIMALRFPQRFEKICLIDVGPIDIRALIESLDIRVSQQVRIIQGLDISNKNIKELEELFISTFGSKYTTIALLSNLKGDEYNYTWKYNIGTMQKMFTEILKWPECQEVYRGRVLSILGSESVSVVKNPIISENYKVFNDLFSKYFPNIDFEVLEGGHDIHLEKPLDALRVLQDFLVAVR